MIKFFRHIRKSLIEKNQMGKPAFAAGRYFKYAIGEIILVVIGILIAIWINSTYNDYKENQVETIILKKLITDLEADYNQLQKADSLNQEYLKR